MPVRGVLFDIDDTLVDLRTANIAAVKTASAPMLPDAGAGDLDALSSHYVADHTARYDAYLRGELSFAGQRIARAQLAFEHIGRELTDDEAMAWNSSYEARAKSFWRAFDDVAPLLDALDSRGIPYGALSNNVTEYQRAKLDACGLVRVSTLVGTDSVGVPKPDPRIFAEGARQLGFSAAEVLFVGDNLVADALGARDAGMISVLLDRQGGQASASEPLAAGSSASGSMHDAGASASAGCPPEAGAPSSGSLAAGSATSSATSEAPAVERVPGATWDGPVIAGLDEVIQFLS